MFRLIKALFIILLIVVGLGFAWTYEEKLAEAVPAIGRLSEYLKGVARAQTDRLQVYLEKRHSNAEPGNSFEEASASKPTQADSNPKDPFQVDIDSGQTGAEENIQTEHIKFKSINLPKPYPIYALVAEDYPEANQAQTGEIQQADEGNYSAARETITILENTIKAEDAIEILKTIRGGLYDE